MCDLMKNIELLRSNVFLVVILLFCILLCPPLLEIQTNSYAAGSSMRPQTTLPKLQSEKMYSVQSPVRIQITNPKNESTITDPYPILRATADTRYNYVQVFVNNQTDYQTYAAKGDGKGHWSLDVTGLLLPGMNNVTVIATFHRTSLMQSPNNNSTIPGPYIPLTRSDSWVYSKIHFELVVPTPVITSPIDGAKIPIDGVTRPVIIGTVDQHYVYVGLSVNMVMTNATVNRTIGEYYNDSIPQNGTGYWSLDLPSDSLRPGLQKITVWLPFVNLIGEPIVKIFAKPMFVEFVCSNGNIILHSHSCAQYNNKHATH